MTHLNRGRLAVDVAADWRIYSASPLPAGARALGVITRGDGILPGSAGALVRLASGVLVQINAGALRSLPQDKAITAWQAAIKGQRGGRGMGQGRKSPDAALIAGPMRRYSVTLDAASVERLRKMADGDLSAGIRRAARDAPAG
jgi:hypothetical protein